METLEKISDTLPRIDVLGVRTSAGAPSWLTNLDEYKKACRREKAVYRKIARITRSLSENRERAKVRKILKISSQHPLIIAYDTRIITLHYLNRFLKHKSVARRKAGVSELESMVVTGSSTRRMKRQISNFLGLGSVKTNLVVFCSDAMAEGVNFQQASAVMFLDLPSVIRLAEQASERIEDKGNREYFLSELGTVSEP